MLNGALPLAHIFNSIIYWNMYDNLIRFDHRVGGTWMSGSIIEDVAFILGEVTDVGYDVQC